MKTRRMNIKVAEDELRNLHRAALDNGYESLQAMMTTVIRAINRGEINMKSRVGEQTKGSKK